MPLHVHPSRACRPACSLRTEATPTIAGGTRLQNLCVRTASRSQRLVLAIVATKTPHSRLQDDGAFTASFAPQTPRRSVDRLPYNCSTKKGERVVKLQVARGSPLRKCAMAECTASMRCVLCRPSARGPHAGFNWVTIFFASATRKNRCSDVGKMLATATLSTCALSEKMTQIR